MNRYAYARNQCLEGSLAAKSSIEGTFDDSRLLDDPDVTKLARILNMTNISLPELLRSLKDKLLSIHYARDISKQAKEQLMLQTQLSTLFEDLVAHSKVQMPQYLQGLDEAEATLKGRLAQGRHVDDVRQRHLRYQRDTISSVRDAGYQFRDLSKGGIVKMEAPRSVPDYLKLLFNFQ